MIILIKELRCWWLGCEPHPQDTAPPEYLECQHCNEIISYEQQIGYKPGFYYVAREFLTYWLCRKWWPHKCVDCGKRGGCHDECLPF